MNLDDEQESNWDYVKDAMHVGELKAFMEKSINVSENISNRGFG